MTLHYVIEDNWQWKQRTFSSNTQTKSDSNHTNCFIREDKTKLFVKVGSQREQKKKIQREQWRNDEWVFLIMSAFVKMEYALLPFYILSTINQAINSIINKSIFVMGLRQCRKWNRKSLLSLASKSIFSKLFFLQHFYLPLGIFFLSGLKVFHFVILRLISVS